MSRMSAPQIASELLKLLRGRTLTRAQIVEELELDYGTARDWCAEWAANGVLVETEGRARSGAAVPAYTLSAEWGGKP